MTFAANTAPDGVQLSGIPVRLPSKIKVLDEAGLEMIHAASLRVLEETGIVIDHPAMVEQLQMNGARADGNRVYLPASLVEKAITSAPARVTLYARDPKRNVYLGRGRVHFTNGFGATWVEDPETHQVRDATLEDLATYTRLADAMDRVDYCLFSVVPQDIPPALLDVECTAVALENTSKHIQLSLETADWLDEVVRIGEIVAGPGGPAPFSAGGVPNSPLHYARATIEKFIRLAQNNIPCFVVCGAMAGATAPVTLPGALVVQNAEVLAGVLVTQLSNPGAPVIYGTFSGGFDMRSTKLALGGPEVSLITAASQQLSERYGIPLGYATGGISDSNLLDVQAGIEKTQSVLFAAAAGVDVVHDAVSGLLGAGMLNNLAGMVIENEEAHTIEYLLGGMPVTEQSLALEVIDRVGPGGTYLDHLHTAENFRKTLWISTLRKRQATKPEETGGRSSLVENGYRQALKLLAAYQPLSLMEEQLCQIAKVRASARERISRETRI